MFPPDKIKGRPCPNFKIGSIGRAEAKTAAYAAQLFANDPHIDGKIEINVVKALVKWI